MQQSSEVKAPRFKKLNLLIDKRALCLIQLPAIVSLCNGCNSTQTELCPIIEDLAATDSPPLSLFSLSPYQLLDRQTALPLCLCPTRLNCTFASAPKKGLFNSYVTFSFSIWFPRPLPKFSMVAVQFSLWQTV